LGESSDIATNNNTIGICTQLTNYVEQGYKHQGDTEYKLNQFERAIELYTQAINMYPCYFTARSNRAACYLQLKKYVECIEDCTFIVNNIHSQQDDMSDNMTSKGNLLLKALVRRAEAFFSLEDYRQAYRDYEQASRMSPDDESLMKELERTSEKLNSQVQAEWFQNRGRYFFKNNDYKSALHLYTLAVNHDPSNPVHYSNRALCYLKLENYVQCVNDCNTGLTVLNADDKQKFDKLNKEKMNTEGAQEVMKEIPTNVLLTPALQVKLYHRRAQAYKMLEEWERSLLDFKRAHHLAPKEVSLLKDMDELQPIVDKIIEKRAHEVKEKEANELVPVVES
jgi:tetratricopeptide (TPR) repeat protein